MRKKRSFVLFATVVLGLSAISFVPVTEARDGPPGSEPSIPPTQVGRPSSNPPSETCPKCMDGALNPRLLNSNDYMAPPSGTGPQRPTAAPGGAAMSPSPPR